MLWRGACVGMGVGAERRGRVLPCGYPCRCSCDARSAAGIAW